MGKVIDFINSTLDIGEEYERIFNKPIPSGKMFCPFHTNVNTPAAKRYGNSIHCFSCNKSYSVYDLLKKYNPKRIDELKSTQILKPSSVNHKKSKITKVTIDRSKDIYSLINDILSKQ